MREMTTVARCRQNRSGKQIRAAFTLIELLVVIAIIAILAAILFPVFAQAREKARQTTCINNLKQVGLSLLQYAQDYDESLPGDYVDASPGRGWATAVYPYFGGGAGAVKSTSTTNVLQCPDDPTEPYPGYTVNSFALNANCITLSSYKPKALTIVDYTAPSKSVMLFEVIGGCLATPAYPNDKGSLAGDGRYLWGGQGYYSRYATGYLGVQGQWNSAASCGAWWNGNSCAGATTVPAGLPNGLVLPQYKAPATGRHQGGSNYLLADGHVKWLPGSSVSAYGNANNENCNENNSPAVAGCSTAYADSAGTNGSINGKPIAATFSVF